MARKKFFTAVTRISDLRHEPFETTELDLAHWDGGDYVVARVEEPPRGFKHVELTTGRMAEVAEGDELVGALGVRHATLEAVGTWRAVESDGRMEALTSAGLLGRSVSLSYVLPALIDLAYLGHVTRGGRKVRMSDFVAPVPEVRYACPTVLIVGTSMSAGKTASAKVIIRQLKAAGELRVVGAKLTGAGRHRDIQAMWDAGADEVFDFVDVGLPSSICSKDEYRPALRALLARIAAAEPDVVVAEAGASPLEPYNGETVLEEIGDQVRCAVLCASDPYAVVGVIQGFDMRPDVVAGLATSTSAGVELVEKLTGLQALNLLDPQNAPRLRLLLEERLGLS